MTAKIFQLNNGIRCLLYDTKCECHNSITINITIKCGSRDESPEYQGLTHFAEHMFFKGTKKRPNGNVISGEIEQYGAQFNAVTDYDVTYYYIKINHKYLDKALDILSDILFNSLFRQDDINSEKEVIINELKLYQNNPSRSTTNMVSRLIYKDTSLDHDIGGSIENIRNATREKFLTYISYFYQTQNIIISLAGHLPSYQKTTKLLSKYFNKKFTYHNLLTNSKHIKNHTFDKNRLLFKNFEHSQTTSRFHYKKVSQIEGSYIVIGFPSYRYASPEYFQMVLLSTILGKGMSSKLFLEVREKRGLTYSIKSNISAYQDLGIFTINCATHSNDIKKTFKLIWIELEKIKKGKLTSTEISKAKENIIGTELLERESTNHLAQTNAYDFLYLNKFLSFNDFSNSINKITKSQLIKLANNLFQKHKLNVAIISNIKLTNDQFKC